MAKQVYTYNVNYNSKKNKSGTGPKRKKTGSRNRLVLAFKKAFSVVMAMIVVSSLFLLYNLQYASVNSHLIAIRKLEHDVEASRRKNDNLKIKIKQLTHVDRIFEKANKELGLNPPLNSPVVFYVDSKLHRQACEKDAGLHD